MCVRASRSLTTAPELPEHHARPCPSSILHVSKSPELIWLVLVDALSCWLAATCSTKLVLHAVSSSLALATFASTSSASASTSPTSRPCERCCIRHCNCRCRCTNCPTALQHCCCILLGQPHSRVDCHPIQDLLHCQPATMLQFQAVEDGLHCWSSSEQLLHRRLCHCWIVHNHSLQFPQVLTLLVPLHCCCLHQMCMYHWHWKLALLHQGIL